MVSRAGGTSLKHVLFLSKKMEARTRGTLYTSKPPKPLGNTLAGREGAAGTPTLALPPRTPRLPPRPLRRPAGCHCSCHWCPAPERPTWRGKGTLGQQPLARHTACLELATLLRQPPELWDQRCTPLPACFRFKPRNNTVANSCSRERLCTTGQAGPQPGTAGLEDIRVFTSVATVKQHPCPPPSAVPIFIPSAPSHRYLDELTNPWQSYKASALWAHHTEKEVEAQSHGRAATQPHAHTSATGPGNACTNGHTPFPVLDMSSVMSPSGTWVR